MKIESKSAATLIAIIESDIDAIGRMDQHLQQIDIASKKVFEVVGDRIIVYRILHRKDAYR